MIKNPVTTYKTLRENYKNNQLHLEAVILILLEKIFEINTKETEIFKKRTVDDEKNINQYDAMFQQIIIKVSHVLFKSRYYLTYRPTVEVIVDMLSFIDIMCRSDKDKCKGSSNPYFHTRRYLYYLKFMLDQYDKGHIVIPTYLSIGATDFVKIRCIPIYLVGCHPESEFADEYYNTPLDFFSHDVQHARRQLYYTEEQLYKLNNKYERFKNNEISRSPFMVDNTIILEDFQKKFDDFIDKMYQCTTNQIIPFLLVPKDTIHKAPLNRHITTFNNDLAKGLRSMRKMIMFELLHEAALVTLPIVMIKGILLSTHTTPIERIADSGDNYANVEDIIYQDPTTLSNVLYKIQGTFFDTKEERIEAIVPVNYRNAVIVALAALQVLTGLSKGLSQEELHSIPELKDINNSDIMFNKLLHLTLNKKNRLQSTTGVAVEGSVDPSRVFTIREVIDENGNLLAVTFDRVHTTRTTIYDDPVLLKNKVAFFGPVLGDQSGKIGIYGGSFDPPHNCHKLRVQHLYDALSLNKIVIAIAANNPRKPDLLPQEDRYKWTLMMIEEILNENQDSFVNDFTSNPKRNNSKFDVTMAEPAAGDTIVRIRTEYPGNDVIFIYGSDYSLKEGNQTPLDNWDKPINYLGETNFYNSVSQIQFLRSEHTCDTSSSGIRKSIKDFISKNDISSINPLTEEDITEEPLSLNLKTFAGKLNMSKKVLLSYIRFIMNSKKGGFNTNDKYFKKYLKYKSKYIELRKLL
jgi:nicotinic acid mononucleotide adenylyltransferase